MRKFNDDPAPIGNSASRETRTRTARNQRHSVLGSPANDTHNISG
jgi:hypothetical protein